MTGPTMTSMYRARDKTLLFRFEAGDGRGLSFQTPMVDWLKGVHLTPEEVAAAVGTEEVPPSVEEPAPFHRAALAALPDDLTGRSVLDVGGYDGRFAGECARRGAAPVRILDNGEWQNYHWRVPPTPDGVERIGCDVLVWEQAADLIVFGNVIYHMRDPWRALRHLRTLCRGEMLMWTSFVPGDEPVWRVEDDAEARGLGLVHEGYFTVFWKPTVAGLLRLLARTGWTGVEELGRFGDHVVVRCQGGPL